MSEEYNAQKKYLSDKKKQLRVWVDAEKYEAFKQAVKKNGESIYGLINKYIDGYIAER